LSRQKTADRPTKEALMLDLSAENLDDNALLELVRRRDPLGVLSIYVDAHPSAGARRSAAPGIDIRNRLAGLERHLESDIAAERANALRRVLNRYAMEIERALDPRKQGRGRALYLPLSGGEPACFSTRLPLPNRVVLDESAFVHPLLELIDEGGQTGVVILSRREANLLEWRLGELRCLRRVAAGEAEAPHERSGPVGSSASSSVATPMREQRAARQRNQQQTLLAETAAAISDLADDLSWERVLISGSERLREPLIRALPQRLQDAVVGDTRALARLTRAELEATVTERLLADNRDRELRLIQGMRESAFGRGPGALGLSEVLAALNEGRVAHLAYDPGVRYTGSIDERGALHPDGEAPPASGALEHEPRLTERIVERCLATGARVTPVEGASADVLAEAGGIAALLRW
jgi:Bacterial archaeo-eukaryotic release factor family 10